MEAFRPSLGVFWPRAAAGPDRSVHLRLPEVWGRCGDPNTQHAFIYHAPRTGCCVAGTKSGKTWGCSEWLLREAWNRPRSKWFWLAPIYRQSLLGESLCLDLVPEHLRGANFAEHRIRLANGSTVQFFSGEKPKDLWGFAFDGGVVDEASRLKAEAWDAAGSWLLRSRGPVRLIGNARGKKNWFYRLWKRGVDGEPGISAHRLRTWDNPHIPPAEIEEARRRFSDRKFRELFGAEFFDDASALFEGYLELMDPGIRPVPEVGHRYLGGLDLGERRDWTVLIIGDVDTGEMKELLRFQRVGWPVQRERIRNAAARWKGLRIYADETGLGGPVVGFLREAGLRIEGITFTNDSKEQMVQAFELAIERRQFRYPEWPLLLGQLEVFDAEILPSGRYRYGAPEGEEDDAAWAAILWNWGRVQQTEGSWAGLKKYMAERAAEARGENQAVRRAVWCVQNDKPMECDIEDWPKARREIRTLAARWVTEDPELAERALRRIREHDQKLGYREVGE